MQNIWTELKNVNIVNTMKLAGCMPKYTRGEASDFECFCAWIACLPLLDGNITAEQFAAEMERILERRTDLKDLCKSSPSNLWCEYNIKKYGFEYEKISDEIFNNPIFLYSKNECDEFFQKSSETFYINECRCNNSEALRMEEFKQKKSSDISCTVDFLDGEFLRPNGYKAAVIADKIKNDEKCTKAEINLLLLQNICEIIYQEKCRKIHLYIKECGSFEYAEQLIKYFFLRGFSARIYFGIEAYMSADEVVSLCQLSNDRIFITPVIRKDAGVDKEHFKAELAKIYPVSLLYTET